MMWFAPGICANSNTETKGEFKSSEFPTRALRFTKYSGEQMTPFNGWLVKKNSNTNDKDGSDIKDHDSPKSTVDGLERK